MIQFKPVRLKIIHLKWMGILLMMMAAGYPISLSAREQPKNTYSLDEVVVSTTRSEIPVFDAAQSVTVISSQELMSSPFERMEDIVRSVPGIYNFRHFALNTNGIVSPLKMRGTGSNRILILVDGVPQNDNFNNAISWVGWGHIPKETIERIEIVRGPTSAIYGSEGLGGVIHIITKKPKTQRQTSIRTEAGSADTYTGQGFHGQKLEKFSFMAAGGYEQSDGFYMVKDPETYEIKRYREVGKVLGKATCDVTPASEISIAALYYDHDMGQGREFFHNDLQLDQYWLNYSHKGDALGLKALVYLNRADKTAFQDTASDNYTSPFREEKFKGTQTWGTDIQGTLLNWKPAQLTVGASFKEAIFEYNEDYTASTRDAGAKGTQQVISPFANLDVHFLNDNLIVTLGARYDWIETSEGANWDTVASGGKLAYSNAYASNTEGNFSPKLGVAWHPDDKTTFRASGGKGFRAPSLFELYKVHVRNGGTYYREANPNLKPEQIWSYDVGVERFITDSLWGRLTFYQSFAEDYIGDRLTGTGVFGGGKTRYEYQLDNISQVDIYGIETELEWYVLADLTLFANYTFNISEVKKDENNATLNGNYLPNDPRHNAHFGFRYNNPKIVTVSVIANYYADIYFDNENTLKENGYFTVDASISRRFFNSFTAYINAENILDKEYPMFRSVSSGDTIAPGIIVTGGIKLTF
ncbi:MAG: TonB-dependent receptor [Proteobacteria bacterium]|nr:TonB-dependent receptor [Pseudomonadota bacterium]MBU1389960.1 TonB-dependent receptor [Pseudomonadota bacterium]MBU1544174.1 TonB-dependent receptor [Pseudomonadota bacterium]MBU2430507.1 TonB-dependent receptor [Pseudomonadota bacterium]MBU2481159.1 TonB-dependent receptor [Pseudomonadota bacterium]